MEYPESFSDFMSGKLTEEDYINRHSDGKWPEIQMLVLNPLLFSQLLLKIRDPGNRRNVLIQSMPIKRDDLEKLLMTGSSLVTDLKRPSTRQIRPIAIAKFGIIYRVPFSWGAREYPGEVWDYHNFDYLENCVLTTRKSLVVLLSPEINIEWSINGYQLKLKGGNVLYLRIERRSDLVVIDLLNPSHVNLEVLIGVVSKVNCHWRFQQMPSLITGHYFYIFFGSKNKNSIDQVVKQEYPLTNRLYDLTAIYGGNK
jgi:hypothetical protein